MLGGNAGKILAVVIAVVVLSILFPIVMDQAVVITGHANIADFTGLEAFVNLTPLLLWLAALGTVLGMVGFSLYQSYKKRKSSKR